LLAAAERLRGGNGRGDAARRRQGSTGLAARADVRAPRQRDALRRAEPDEPADPGGRGLVPSAGRRSRTRVARLDRDAGTASAHEFTEFTLPRVMATAIQDV